MNISEIGYIKNPANFEPIYPEGMADRELRKMELKTGKKRATRDVLKYMRQYNQKPLRICMRCDKTCIQRQVAGLTYFKCEVRNG